MLNIKFSEKWDKLETKNIKKGKKFTTFRGYAVSKQKYYENCIGSPFEILFSNERSLGLIGHAKLIKISYKWAKNVTEREIKKDTYNDWNKEDFKKLMLKFYKIENPFLIKLTFEWI